jgi:hypothetical protein
MPALRRELDESRASLRNSAEKIVKVSPVG